MSWTSFRIGICCSPCCTHALDLIHMGVITICWMFFAVVKEPTVTRNRVGTPNTCSKKPRQFLDLEPFSNNMKKALQSAAQKARTPLPSKIKRCIWDNNDRPIWPHGISCAWSRGKTAACSRGQVYLPASWTSISLLNMRDSKHDWLWLCSLDGGLGVIKGPLTPNGWLRCHRKGKRSRGAVLRYRYQLLFPRLVAWL